MQCFHICSQLSAVLLIGASGTQLHGVSVCLVVRIDGSGMENTLLGEMAYMPSSVDALGA